MTQTTASITYDSDHALGTTVARLRYNKGLPQTVTNEAGEAVPNPDLIADDAAYLALRGGDLVKSWYDNNQDAFRIPTGEWLQRWTDAERKAAFALGRQSEQVQAWLDDMLANPIINLSDPRVTQGVPAVCQTLAQTGVIAPEKLQERLDAILALNV